ncbi:Do family serine endopeptidase [Pontibacter akesuensis]|uniref:Do/DeqQ family serine protease n=1 Tax=Pontibacter akesuensis TaxID=388950 RepID=A0A1I7JGN3_9BACT|nr:Do family serine endopeptidase [Pontibacter akesuensis]GHA70137.1 serine protease [Pontibacter akesuensis]SFU84280.1 Do/DeqQ family serine protease [Pontibacter akesuensis]
MKTKQFILGVALSAVVGGGVAVGSYKMLEDDQVLRVQDEQQYPTVRYTSDMRSSNVVVPEGLNFVNAAQVSTPAVVHVMTEYTARSSDRYSSQMDPFLREFFGDGFGQQVPRGPQMGSGSGVIIASNGYIVTNNHVIDKADKIEVVMDDKRTFVAKLVGTDPTTDIALLKIEAEKLPTIRYGNSDELRVGEWVLAVGNPMNLTSTVTAGIVSAKGRNINILRTRANKDMSIESFIQTDAAVNPGNSGGALVNLNGDLVGINTAIASQTGQFAGYSFAVPSSIVSKVVDDLLKYGEVQRALLGASIQEIDAAFAKEKGLKTLNGVYIAQVQEKSGAEEANLKAGDVITAINGVTVAKSSQLLEQIARYRPGDKVKVSYLRDGKEKSTNVTLKNLENSTELVKHSEAKAITFEGATFEPVSKQEMSKLGITGGAKVSGINSSKFRETGMKDGFIITRIDKYEVNQPSDVEKYLKNFDGGVVYIEGVYPDGLKAYYPIGKG